MQISPVQEAPPEDNNSADIALGRFGREPAAQTDSDRDRDVLSAATAVQRWELDHSHSKRERRSSNAEQTDEAAGVLHRPLHPGTIILYFSWSLEKASIYSHVRQDANCRLLLGSCHRLHYRLLARHHKLPDRMRLYAL